MNFNLPEYSKFYKFLLVEELALCSPFVYYGKCSLLGYLLRPDTLGSLTIPNINNQYQVPDCTFSVRLKMDVHPVQLFNTTVEVFGEVRFFDVLLGPDSTLESSHSLALKMKEYEEFRILSSRSTNNKTRNYNARLHLQHKIEDFKSRYQVVIEVDSIRHVYNARDTIAKNLQFRIIQAKRKTLQLYS